MVGQERMTTARNNGIGIGRGLEEAREALAAKIAKRAPAEGETVTGIAGLRLYRRSEPSPCASAAYQPSLVVFVQGEKRVNLGKTIYVCDGSNFLLTSIDLPVVSQVTKACAKEPLLGM